MVVSVRWGTACFHMVRMTCRCWTSPRGAACPESLPRPTRWAAGARVKHTPVVLTRWLILLIACYNIRQNCCTHIQYRKSISPGRWCSFSLGFVKLRSSWQRPGHTVPHIRTFLRAITITAIYFIFYLTGTVHSAQRHFCKYTRFSQKASFHLQSLAKCNNRLPKRQITRRVIIH